MAVPAGVCMVLMSSSALKPVGAARARVDRVESYGNRRVLAYELPKVVGNSLHECIYLRKEFSYSMALMTQPAQAVGRSTKTLAERLDSLYEFDREPVREEALLGWRK